MIQAGQMRERVTLQYPLNQGDGQGGGRYTWHDVATMWASIQTESMTPFQLGYTNSASSFRNMERFEENQQRRVNHYLVTIRFRGNVSTSMRFLYNNRILKIESVVNVNERNWAITMYCVEEGE